MAENIGTKARAREHRSKRISLCDQIVSYVQNNSVSRKDVMKKFNLSTEELRIQINKVKEKYGISLFG